MLPLFTNAFYEFFIRGADKIYEFFIRFTSFLS